MITAVGIGIGSGGSVLYSNSNGKGEQERGELVYHQTITLLFAAAMVLLIVLGFTYPAILSALGAKGDVYQKAVEYIQIIIFGAVFQVIGEILKIGISAFGLSLAPSIVLLFTNLQCLKYGGDAAVACYAVISYIVFPVQSMLMGIGDGTQPLMSFYSGAKKMEELRFVKKIASIAVVGMGAVFFECDTSGEKSNAAHLW